VDPQYVTRREFEQFQDEIAAQLGDLRGDVAEAQRAADSAAAGFALIRGLLQESVADLKRDGAERTAALMAMLQAHDAQIRQWQGWIGLARSAGLLLVQMPVWRGLAGLVRWLFIVLAGAGLGGMLFALVMWR
jgi:hypothetical protein